MTWLAFPHMAAVYPPGIYTAGGNPPYDGSLLAQGGSYPTSLSPIWVPSISPEWRWTSMSGNDTTALAIKSDGTLWTWGSNQFGGLGTGLSTSTTQYVPLVVDTNAYLSAQANGILS